MASKAEQSIGDRIELHNQAARLKTAKEKLASGRPLTKAEQAAVSQAESDKARQIAMPWLRAMPKGEFVELVGGSTRVYLDWEKAHGLPWHKSKPSVDALELLRWFRDQFAAAGSPAGSAATRKSDAVDRFNELRAKKAEAEYELMMGRLVYVEDANRDVEAIAKAVRGGIERLERYGRDAQQVMIDVLDEIKEQWSLSDEDDSKA